MRILPAGAVIRTEQAEVRAEVPQYQEMAERAGVFFFFEDEELPELPFFAVPGLELAARDRDGSWYGRSEALGEGVYCVTPEGAAFLVSEGHGPIFQPPAGGGRRSGSCGSQPWSLTVTHRRRRRPRRWKLVPVEELLPKGWKEREK